MTALRREGADPVSGGRPWGLPLEDRFLLVAAYWRTNLALRPRTRFWKDTVLIVDGTLVPTRDHTIAEQSKNYRYSTNQQVLIDADTRLVVAVGRPVPGHRNDCKAWGCPERRTPSAGPL
ncbi:transposase [Streptomyces werraensis]|uniref:transposase n=1 Tax=Streptomyces werraensis TaxID=68284 RepID=UPI003F4D9D4D